MDGSQKTTSGDQTPLNQLAAADFALREGFQDFRTVFACVFSFPDSCFRGFFRQEESIISINAHSWRSKSGKPAKVSAQFDTSCLVTAWRPLTGSPVVNVEGSCAHTRVRPAVQRFHRSRAA